MMDYVQNSTIWLFRVLLAELLIHFCIASGMDAQYQQWESTITRISACVCIMCFGNVLKALLARTLSRHFHTKSYFERMQDAVQKEYFLMELAKERRSVVHHAWHPGEEVIGALSHISQGLGSQFRDGWHMLASKRRAFGSTGQFPSESGNDIGSVSQSPHGVISTSNGERVGCRDLGTASLPLTKAVRSPFSISNKPDSKSSAAAFSGGGAADVQGTVHHDRKLAPAPAEVGVSTESLQEVTSDRYDALMQRRSFPGGAITLNHQFQSSVKTGSHQCAAQPEDEGLPLLPPGTLASTVSVPLKGRQGAGALPQSGSQSSGLVGAGALPQSGSQSSGLGAAGVAITRAVTALKDSYNSVSLMERQRSRGDVVLVPGFAGPKPMLASEAAAAAAAAVAASTRGHVSSSDGGRLFMGSSKEGSRRGGDQEAYLKENTAGINVDPTLLPLHSAMMHQTYDIAPMGSNKGVTASLVTNIRANGSTGGCWNDAKTTPETGMEASSSYPGVIDRTGVFKPLACSASGNKRVWSDGPHRSNKPAGKKHNSNETGMSLYWLEQHVRTNKLKFTSLTYQLGAAADQPDAINEITNKTEAKRLAFFLYCNVLGRNLTRPYIVPRDLEAFFDSPEEVRACFKILDVDNDGQATLSNMVDAIVLIYKERKKLALTLKDTKSVVAKLELVCGVVIHIAFMFIYLYIFQVDISNLWVSISTIALGFVFVFGNSVKTLYESVLYLFVVHAFDVGDWLQLSTGAVVKVEEIALMCITAMRDDGRRFYIPTSWLGTQITINLSRSENYWDSFALLVDYDAPSSVLELLEVNIKRFISENPREFTGNAGVIATALENPQKLKIVAYWELTHTADDSGRTGKWKSKLLMCACQALKSAGVLYSAAPEAPYPLSGPIQVAGSNGLSAQDALMGGGGAQLYFSTKMRNIFTTEGVGKVYTSGTAADPTFGATINTSAAVPAPNSANVPGEGLRYRG
ncbi:hypothetical protein CEUSTIGMA_g5683.t1 [Chlamydomonas eustigma]|uniref:EF-hand domain-containing protein n=1 Tax=Chlamydomonas eustigma TaxID=1157962 RepID=A0A250X587_9CHLO|nr:hypothetical protein CEUSTIGMA_g5683.t1 [Chlamydomonas eustigma]|eukprot:GAX78241.1 hypothetical protein CEUSTIGMA_g5683.t1 [Chlamydomonas eustigma]